MSATVDMTFKNLYESIVGGKYDIIKSSEQLSSSTLLSVSVGQDKKSLSCVEVGLNVVEVTAVFGSYV